MHPVTRSSNLCFDPFGATVRLFTTKNERVRVVCLKNFGLHSTPIVLACRYTVQRRRQQLCALPVQILHPYHRTQSPNTVCWYAFHLSLLLALAVGSFKKWGSTSEVEGGLTPGGLGRSTTVRAPLILWQSSRTYQHDRRLGPEWSIQWRFDDNSYTKCYRHTTDDAHVASIHLLEIWWTHLTLWKTDQKLEIATSPCSEKYAVSFLRPHEQSESHFRQNQCKFWMSSCPGIKSCCSHLQHARRSLRPPQRQKRLCVPL